METIDIGVFQFNLFGSKVQRTHSRDLTHSFYFQFKTKNKTCFSPLRNIFVAAPELCRLVVKGRRVLACFTPAQGSQCTAGNCDTLRAVQCSSNITAIFNYI